MGYSQRGGKSQTRLSEQQQEQREIGHPFSLSQDLQIYGHLITLVFQIASSIYARHERSWLIVMNF